MANTDADLARLAFRFVPLGRGGRQAPIAHIANAVWRLEAT